jgi:hypothetical protein
LNLSGNTDFTLSSGTLTISSNASKVALVDQGQVFLWTAAEGLRPLL